MPAHIADKRGTTRPVKKRTPNGQAPGFRNYPDKQTIHRAGPKAQQPPVAKTSFWTTAAREGFTELASRSTSAWSADKKFYQHARQE